MKAETLYIPDLAALLPEIPPDSIVSRTVYVDEQVRGTLFGFATGQELTEHTAASPAILHFLQGEARLTLGEETMTAQNGTWVYMPAHLPHSIRAESPCVMLLLLLKTKQG